MYVHTIVDGMACMCSIYLYYPASLTMSLAVVSAPCCRRSEQVSVLPLMAASWRAVLPNYNNRETERQRERDRSDQRHTGEKHRHTDRGGQQDRSGQGREEKVRLGYSARWRGAAIKSALRARTWPTFADRTALHGYDVDQAPSQWTTMDRETITQGTSPIDARRFQRETKRKIQDNESAFASHTYRRSIQETLACEDACHSILIILIDLDRSELYVWETAPHAAATITSMILAAFYP
jgi:hypothetical protein